MIPWHPPRSPHSSWHVCCFPWNHRPHSKSSASLRSRPRVRIRCPTLLVQLFKLGLSRSCRNLENHIFGNLGQDGHFPKLGTFKSLHFPNFKPVFSCCFAAWNQDTLRSQVRGLPEACTSWNCFFLRAAALILEQSNTSSRPRHFQNTGKKCLILAFLQKLRQGNWASLRKSSWTLQP